MLQEPVVGQLLETTIRYQIRYQLLRTLKIGSGKDWKDSDVFVEGAWCEYQGPVDSLDEARALRDRFNLDYRKPGQDGPGVITVVHSSVMILEV